MALDKIFDVEDLKTMKTIAIIGGKGCGKSTLADALEVKYGARVVSFASPIKNLLYREFGLSMDQLTDPVQKELPFFHAGLDTYVTPRKMMQEFGTEFVRFIDNTYWITSLLIDLLLNTSTDVHLIDDMRMHNEAAYMRHYTDCTIIRVDRPSVESKDMHESEQQFKLIEPDFVVDNSSDVDTMVNIVDEFLTNVMPPV